MLLFLASLLDEAHLMFSRCKAFAQTLAPNHGKSILDAATSSPSEKSYPWEPRGTFPFQRLPREIRQEIYSYLGFPIGKCLWQRCWMGEYCDKHSHFSLTGRNRFRTYVHRASIERKRRISQATLKCDPEGRRPLRSLTFRCEDGRVSEYYPQQRQLALTWYLLKSE